MDKKLRVLIATIHPWNIANARQLKRRMKNVRIIKDKELLTQEYVRKFDPAYIFFPHWSWRIPEEIHRHYKCVVFHMTDLPFGRGGSPLQNLIVKGITSTKISALRVVEAMDAGPVYLKKPLKLNGTAKEIYQRASTIIFEEMIPTILNKNIFPKPQQGRTVIFKRRKPEEGDLNGAHSLKSAFDYIRMLDAPGYPPAFIQAGHLRICFSGAVLKKDSVTAQAQITWSAKGRLDQ